MQVSSPFDSSHRSDMTQQPRQIFRQGPLERLASPERLDELLAVVRPQSWLLLLTLGVGLALVAVWSVVGRIPVTAGGTAILVRPKQVVAFQASTAGQIASLRAAVGDEVRRGDLLARLDLPELEQELEQERTKLSNFDLRSGE